VSSSCVASKRTRATARWTACWAITPGQESRSPTSARCSRAAHSVDRAATHASCRGGYCAPSIGSSVR